MAVIDTHTRRLRGLVKFEAGSKPTRLVRDDAARVWVGLEGRGEVALVDAAAMKEAARVAIGAPGALLLARRTAWPWRAMPRWCWSIVLRAASRRARRSTRRRRSWRGARRRKRSPRSARRSP